jgi:uncharacterized membrane protein YpjA
LGRRTGKKSEKMKNIIPKIYQINYTSYLILISILIFLNTLAVFVGYIFYYEQFLQTPWYLYIFVPDCPLYVLLAIPIILGLKNETYRFLVSTGLLKYGIWTIFVFFVYSSYYFSDEVKIVTILFIFGHLGMILQGLAFLPYKNVKKSMVLIAIAWFILNDFIDYYIGTRPFLPQNDVTLPVAEAIISTILIPLFLFKLGKKDQPIKIQVK